MIAIAASREWLTAAEAAAEDLPGFKFDERHIRRLIRGDEFATRARKGAIGRTALEFHWSCLPPEARDEYLKRYGFASNALSPDANPNARAAQKDLQAEARASIVAAFDAYFEAHKSTRTKALQSFCSAFSKRRVKLDGWVFEAIASVAPHQVRLWSRRLRHGGSSALLDARGRPQGSGLFETDLALRNYAVAAIAARPHLAATHLKSLVRTDLGRDIPLRTVQHFMAGFRKSNAPEIKALTNPDRYRSHHRPAFGVVGARVERINARWEIDASPADAMCIVEGQPCRFKLVGLVDVFTRRAIVLVSDQVRAVATMALLRRAILAWGMPELVKIDNGREFKNRAVDRFLHDAGIKAEFSRAFHPEEKPHIERFFGTLNRDLFELLPGYIGHSVAERQGIEARKSFAHRFGEDANLCFGVELSPEGLQARIDEWCERIYAEKPHEGIGLAPAQKALAHAADVRRLSDERVLDALMLDAPDAGGIRLVAKSGIRIGNRRYVAGELGAWMGHRVHCRFDPHEPSRIVVYSHDRARFVCIAEDRDAMAHADLARVAQEAKAKDRARISDIRSATRKVQKLYPANTAADRLLLAAGSAFTPSEQSTDAMRLASRPALVAHARALEALDAEKIPEQPIEPTEEQLDSARVFFLEEAEKQTPPPEQFVQCSGYTRPRFVGDEIGFYAWLEEHRDILDADDARVLREFETDSAFQDMLQAHRASRRASA